MAPKTRKRKISSPPITDAPQSNPTLPVVAPPQVAPILSVASTSTKFLDVPEMNEKESYETWKTKIKKWCLFNGGFKDQALFLAYKLKDKAYRAVENINALKLQGENGMDILFDALDKVFLPDKIQRHFDRYCTLHTMKRSPGGDINDFLNEFDFEYEKFQAVYGALPEPIPAFMLLLACNLNEGEGRVVRAGLKEDVNYDSMRETLKRVFSAQESKQFRSASELKTEQIFYTNETEGFGDEIFFARGGFNSRNMSRRSGGRSVSRFRGGSR